LKELHHQGMDGARINTAYNDVTYFGTVVKSIRRVADIPILIDIKGPNIRLQTKKKFAVQKGDHVFIGFGSEGINFNFDFYNDVDVGDRVLIDNGRIETQIIGKENRRLKLTIHNEGIIDDRKGVNVPNKQLPLPHLSSKDYRSIKFAVDNQCEFIALSFTRSREDIDNLKKVATNFEGAIVAKIENFEGVNNFKEILQVSDGIMVARGDLGVEIEPERVPILQKWMINLCNNAGKTVITATDILESMIDSPIPSRSEVSDVANAILDGTDCIMTSGETAIGKYPVQTIRMLNKIASEVEKSVESQVEVASFINISESVSHSIQRIAGNMPLDKIVTLTRSGYTARMISRLKPTQEIIAVTPNSIVRKQLEIAYGVTPIYQNYLNGQERILSVAKNLYSLKLIDDEDVVLFTAASRTTEEHYSNIIEIHRMKEMLKFIETNYLECN
jgi:pyruvate kinase